MRNGLPVEHHQPAGRLDLGERGVRLWTDLRNRLGRERGFIDLCRVSKRSLHVATHNPDPMRQVAGLRHEPLIERGEARVNRLVRMDERRPWCGRGVYIEHRGKGLVVHLDQANRFRRRCLIDSSHGGDRLTDAAHDFRCE